MTMARRACDTSASTRSMSVEGIADIDAVGGGEALGDPEQPVEAHRMVDAERAGMAEHGVERVAERLEVARRPAPAGESGARPQSWPAALK